MAGSRRIADRVGAERQRPLRPRSCHCRRRPWLSGIGLEPTFTT